MRMWMVDPRILCIHHLLGEHKEIHMLVGHLSRKRQLGKYITNNCLEPLAIKLRHDLICEEMKARGWVWWRTPIDTVPDLAYLPIGEREYRVDSASSLRDLINRCPECKANYERTKTNDT